MSLKEVGYYRTRGNVLSADDSSLMVIAKHAKENRNKRYLVLRSTVEGVSTALSVLRSVIRSTKTKWLGDTIILPNGSAIHVMLDTEKSDSLRGLTFHLSSL